MTTRCLPVLEQTAPYTTMTKVSFIMDSPVEKSRHSLTSIPTRFICDEH